MQSIFTSEWFEIHILFSKSWCLVRSQELQSQPKEL